MLFWKLLKKMNVFNEPWTGRCSCSMKNGLKLPFIFIRKKELRMFTVILSFLREGFDNAAKCYIVTIHWFIWTVMRHPFLLDGHDIFQRSKLLINGERFLTPNFRFYSILTAPTIENKKYKLKITTKYCHK